MSGASCGPLGHLALSTEAYGICSFLDSLERVTHPKYMPTDGALRSIFRASDDFSSEYLTDLLWSHFADDILRARLKTLGVSEHRFQIKEGEKLR